jgi:hypothetical protein
MDFLCSLPELAHLSKPKEKQKLGRVSLSEKENHARSHARTSVLYISDSSSVLRRKCAGGGKVSDSSMAPLSPSNKEAKPSSEMPTSTKSRFVTATG